MSKKDYVRIAAAIKEVYERTSNSGKIAVTEVACNLSDEMKSDNSRFDRHKFMAACGME